MAHNKTTDQPGSNDKQANSKRTRNTEAHDTGGDRPNMEQSFGNQDKSKIGPANTEDIHEKTKSELAEERGGHGHSGHSGSRNGSRKRQ